MGISEIEVILNLKQFIEEYGLFKGEKYASKTLIHRHSTLLSLKELKPFHNIEIMGKYPDILIELEDSGIVAIEAKGIKGFDKGFGQAVQYLTGANYSYLSADEDYLKKKPAIIRSAKNSGIGILGVKENGEVNELLLPKEPSQDPSELRKIRNSLNNTYRIEEGYNVFRLVHPKNYFIIPLIIAESKGSIVVKNLIEELEKLNWTEQPNKIISKMVKGAQILRLITTNSANINEETILRNTLEGRVVTSYYSNIDNLKRIIYKSSRTPFYELDPGAGAILKQLLLKIPQTQILIEVLEILKEKQKVDVNIIDLLSEIAILNWNFVLDFCVSRKFLEKYQTEIDNKNIEDGIKLREYLIKCIPKLEKSDINTGFNYMLKRLLNHAGIIKGKVYTTGYEIQKDNWKLIL